jgi:hypothetical protein
VVVVRDVELCDVAENFSQILAHSLNGRRIYCFAIPAYACARYNTVCTIPQRAQIENGDGERRRPIIAAVQIELSMVNRSQPFLHSYILRMSVFVNKGYSKKGLTYTSRLAVAGYHFLQILPIRVFR